MPLIAASVGRSEQDEALASGFWLLASQSMPKTRRNNEQAQEQDIPEATETLQDWFRAPRLALLVQYERYI